MGVEISNEVFVIDVDDITEVIVPETDVTTVVKDWVAFAEDSTVESDNTDPEEVAFCPEVVPTVVRIVLTSVTVACVTVVKTTELFVLSAEAVGVSMRLVEFSKGPGVVRDGISVAVEIVLDEGETMLEREDGVVSEAALVFPDELVEEPPVTVTGSTVVADDSPGGR